MNKEDAAKQLVTETFKTLTGLKCRKNWSPESISYVTTSNGKVQKI